MNYKYRKISNIRRTPVGNKSLRCSWGIPCRRYPNYIFILDLTPGFNGLDKDNCKMRWETFKVWESVRLILEIWRYESLTVPSHHPLWCVPKSMWWIKAQGQLCKLYHSYYSMITLDHLIVSCVHALTLRQYDYIVVSVIRTIWGC